MELVDSSSVGGSLGELSLDQLGERIVDLSGRLAAATGGGSPRSLAAGVVAAGRIMPSAAFASLGEFSVSVEGELIAVPYRIYNVEPDATAMLELSEDASRTQSRLSTAAR